MYYYRKAGPGCLAQSEQFLTSEKSCCDASLPSFVLITRQKVPAQAEEGSFVEITNRNPFLASHYVAHYLATNPISGCNIDEVFWKPRGARQTVTLVFFFGVYEFSPLVCYASALTSEITNPFRYLL